MILRNEPTSKEDLPVWFAYKDIVFSYTQLRYFILPNFNELREGFYPVEPTVYKTYFGQEGRGIWVEGTCSTGSKRRGRGRNPQERAIIIAAEVDFRISQIPTYKVRIDSLLVPINGSLITDAYIDSLPLNAVLLEEADRMLGEISGWKRKKSPPPK